MVLEEATSREDVGFTSDSQPQSDSDPYASQSASQSGTKLQVISKFGVKYNLDLDQLPKPSFAFGPQVAAGNIAQRLWSMEALLERPLEDNEFNAAAYHVAHGVRYLSYVPLAGAALSAFLCLRSAKTFKFPLWKPGPAFNPDRFGPIAGPYARLSWHGLRLGAWTAMGVTTSLVVGASFTSTVIEVGSLKDPRLKSYQEAVQKRMREQPGQVNRPAVQRSPVQTQEGMMDRQAMGAARSIGMDTSYSKIPSDPTYSRGTSQIQRAIKEYDDQSPTGGAFTDDVANTTSSNYDSGLLDDTRAEQRNQRQQSNDELYYRAKNAVANNRLPQSTQRPSDDFYFDDASPTAQAGSSSSSNAWDLLRGDARSTAPRTQAQQKQGSTVGDGFAFSSTDEERQLAKTEAQAEFDARVEKERRGGDFSQSSRGYGSAGDGGTSDTANAWERLRRK